jgi:succinate-semialdehyde dehydrogenase/glutarate-semialdehyde dehydrogenase
VTTTVRTVNPADGRELARYPVCTAEELRAILDRADRAARGWAGLPVQDRAGYLVATAKRLRDGREDFARLITSEMGKPLTEALGEVDKCAWNCEYVAEHAEQFLADEPVRTNARQSWISYEPLGVVLAVMPWNFPFWQVLRFACAALIAGNAAVLKHAPNVTGCALAIEALFADAGLPEGVFSAIVVDESNVSQTIAELISDPRISAVTLTGSERAGVSVGIAAGGALKKTVLELGGSDPLVVLADADLDAAVAAATQSRFGNAGQSCVAAKRFIVAEAVADEFVAKLAERVSALLVGDPLRPDTRIGPLARPDLVDAIDRQVRASLAAGATLVAGGRRLPLGGSFYAPTVLDDVRPGMAVFAEETFGPVAAVVRFADDDEAVALANDTPYGLGAAVWGRPDHALRVGRRIRSGALFVNAVVASDPRLPFGGIRRSGHGRELAAAGVREFTNLRTVWVGDSAAATVFTAITE